MSATAPIRIAPSVLNADFGCLADEIAAVTSAGAELLHIDVMDGHFVPNLAIGVPVLQSIRQHTELFLDTHLMVTDPAKLAPAFVDAGANSITFHIEVTPEPEELIRDLRKLGVRVGVSLNPGTPADAITKILPLVDIVLVMTVWPGFGGQKFMAECLPKIEVLARQMRDDQWLEVDGGINADTAPLAIAAGADTLIIGSAIFAAADPGQAYTRLAQIAAHAQSEAEQQA